MKRLLSILLSVDERMVILDSYVNDSLSYIMAKRIAGIVCNDRLCFSLQHVESETGVQSCQK